jgi:hypothetical protein
MMVIYFLEEGKETWEGRSGSLTDCLADACFPSLRGLTGREVTLARRHWPSLLEMSRHRSWRGKQEALQALVSPRSSDVWPEEISNQPQSSPVLLVRRRQAISHAGQGALAVQLPRPGLALLETRGRVRAWPPREAP